MKTKKPIWLLLMLSMLFVNCGSTAGEGSIGGALGGMFGSSGSASLFPMTPEKIFRLLIPHALAQSAPTSPCDSTDFTAGGPTGISFDEDGTFTDGTTVLSVALGSTTDQITPVANDMCDTSTGVNNSGNTTYGGDTVYFIAWMIDQAFTMSCKGGSATIGVGSKGVVRISSGTIKIFALFKYNGNEYNCTMSENFLDGSGMSVVCDGVSGVDTSESCSV